MDQFLWSLLACDVCILILAKVAIHFDYFFAEISYKLHNLHNIVELVTLRHMKYDETSKLVRPRTHKLLLRDCRSI